MDFAIDFTCSVIDIELSNMTPRFLMVLDCGMMLFPTLMVMSLTKAKLYKEEATKNSVF